MTDRDDQSYRGYNTQNRGGENSQYENRSQGQDRQSSSRYGGGSTNQKSGASRGESFNPESGFSGRADDSSRMTGDYGADEGRYSGAGMERGYDRSDFDASRDIYGSSNYGQGGQKRNEQNYGESRSASSGQNYQSQNYGRGRPSSQDFGSGYQGGAYGNSPMRDRQYEGGNYGSSRYGAPSTNPSSSRFAGSQEQQGRNMQGGERGMWDRATDEVSSWFGDDEAAQRRRMDEMRANSKRGRGPSNYMRSDERIKDDVNDKLSDDWDLDATNIDVSVDEGEVTLSGTVETRQDKRRAEDIVDDLSGVKHVQNNLRIAGASSSTSQTTSLQGSNSNKAGSSQTRKSA